MLDYLLSVMGKENFAKVANEDVDKSGRNCLIIAAKHCEGMLVLSLIQVTIALCICTEYIQPQSSRDLDLVYF